MNQQLTFSSLKARQPAPANVIVNPSVHKADERRLKRQAIAIYNHLKVKPIWTNQLSLIAKQYNARLKEIRAWIAPQGLTIDIIKAGKGPEAGNNCYAIRPIAGSKYQAKLMARQAKKINQEH